MSSHVFPDRLLPRQEHLPDLASFPVDASSEAYLLKRSLRKMLSAYGGFFLIISDSGTSWHLPLFQ